MTYPTLTQQALDQQAIAQQELDGLLEAQAQTVALAAPSKDPLTDRDRTIIATVVSQSDYPHDCQPQDVVTIWINSDGIVWVKMSHGFARFHKEPFKAAVAEVKATLPETPRERNERLSAELETACTKFGLWHGEIDWVSFSTKVFRGKDLVGFVGCNDEGWYSRPRQYGRNRISDSASTAIASLGARVAVAA
ncbi:hypothetical protein I8751_16865 [Nostocaceae cyanobacterium CENA357]|uniref:Uncharacterized protein n=1 Tax=Atlanticothrix silvestris CENA357 TaxID=1725252 RepID=A0A8J7HFB5_9CYAN|nr:hypothetical protein [Atlanticothrix silvestris]MBH8554009.1 hypothetical protein [Atlanticothrix silvestris CENA357]